MRPCAIVFAIFFSLPMFVSLQLSSSVNKLVPRTRQIKERSRFKVITGSNLPEMKPEEWTWLSNIYLRQRVNLFSSNKKLRKVSNNSLQAYISHNWHKTGSSCLHKQGDAHLVLRRDWGTGKTELEDKIDGDFYRVKLWRKGGIL